MRTLRLGAVILIAITLFWPMAADAASRPVTVGKVLPMTAPCSGVGQQIPGIQPPLFWNGCVYATAGLRARSHSGTGFVTGTEPIITTYPFGTKVHISCYLNGVSVTGPNGPTSIWDAVGIFQEPGGGVSVYGPGPFAVSSDAWIYTGSNNPVVGHC